MTPLERRSVGVLALIYALRMAGLFLIFPVFALYAQELRGQTPELIGLALGAYGFTQTLLQIPFGAASDRLGRKPVIIAGLAIFALGSVVAALSTSIWGVILGRALQGAGAIPAAVMALLADVTRDEQRNKAMAIVGISIGGSMLLSIPLGPVLYGWVGMPGIFWLTCAGALLAALVLWVGIPEPVRHGKRHEITATQFRQLLRDPQLSRLDVGVFILHMALPAMFIVVPHLIVDQLNVFSGHGAVYLWVIVAAVITMAPFLRLGNRSGRIPMLLTGGVAVLLVAEAVLAFGHAHTWWLVTGLWLFFTGFILLESLLPSLVSRVAPAHSKGAAIGIYTTAQFLGVAIGGPIGGFLYSHTGATGVFIFVATSLSGWLVAVVTMPRVTLTAKIS